MNTQIPTESKFPDLATSAHDKGIVFFIMLVSWFSLYAAVHQSYNSIKLKKKVVLDTRNRIVSMVHGVVSFSLACVAFTTSHFNQPNSALLNFICLFSLSYTIYDLVACLYYGLWDAGLIIHHGLCFLGFGSAIIYNYGGIDSIGGLFVAQVSNFPMHLRVIFRNLGLRYTKAYEYSENLYLGSYIVARGIICPLFVLWPSLQSENSPIMVQIICFSLTVQSYYYILQMSKIIRKKIAQYNEMQKKGVTYQWLEESPDVKKLSFYRTSDGPKIF